MKIRYFLSFLFLSSQLLCKDLPRSPYFSLEGSYVSGKVSLSIDNIFNPDSTQNVYGFRFSVVLDNLDNNLSIKEVTDNYGSSINYDFNEWVTDGDWNIYGKVESGYTDREHRLDIVFDGWGRSDIRIDSIYILAIKDHASFDSLLHSSENSIPPFDNVFSDSPDMLGSQRNVILIKDQALGLIPPTPYWIFIISICVSVIVLLVCLGYTLNDRSRYSFGLIIAIFLASSYIYNHAYQISIGAWMLEHSLPLHLCGMSTILSIVVLVYPKQNLYEFLYFVGISGAIHSLLTPEFSIGSEGFLFYEYFISHGGILLSSLYLTIALGMRPRQGSWWKVFLYSQLLIPLVGGINYLIDANYIYLCEAPDVDNPLMFTKVWPYYIPAVQFIAFIHCFVLYLPIYMLNRRKK